MMKEKKKIRIFDDEKGLRKALKEKVERVGLDQNEFDINVFEQQEFNDALNGIENRQRVFRERGSWEDDKSENLLDDVSILIIDFDLFETHPFLKADSVAYLARCFTTCGVIVVLNRNGHNPFDLTLKDHPGSFADLDIGQDQLDNPFLWETGHSEFAPWHWPILPKLVEDYEKRVRDIEEGLKAEKTIWDILEFSQETKERLPEEIKRLVDPGGEDGRIDRFVAESDFGLEHKDREKALSGNEVVDSKTIARIVAARIGKWLEYVILPELDILIDAPHLISKLPGLVQGEREISAWNEVAIRHSIDVPRMNTEPIEGFRLRKPHWLSRPVWFWRDIIENADIPDIRSPWKVEHPNFVFCEDTSAFHPEAECHEFEAETISPFSTRYIRKIKGVDYTPPTRLAM